MIKPDAKYGHRGPRSGSKLSLRTDTNVYVRISLIVVFRLSFTPIQNLKKHNRKMNMHFYARKKVVTELTNIIVIINHTKCAVNQKRIQDCPVRAYKWVLHSLSSIHGQFFKIGDHILLQNDQSSNFPNIGYIFQNTKWFPVPIRTPCMGQFMRRNLLFTLEFILSFPYFYSPRKKVVYIHTRLLINSVLE